MTAATLPIAEIRNVLRSLPVPVFMAGLDNEKSPRLTLHVAAPYNAREAARQTRAALEGIGCNVPVKARQWDRGAFAAHASLEAASASLAHETVVFDPTAAVWRSHTMVELAKALREAMGEPLVGLYLEPKTRTVYLLMQLAAFDKDGFFDETMRMNLTRTARDVLVAWRKQRRSSIDLSARLCFQLPAYPLVAIDDASPCQLSKGGLFRKARLMAASAAVLAVTALGFGAGSAKAEGPAVSGPNVKLDVGGGFVNDEGAGLAHGLFTFPIGDQFGAHIEGAAGVLDDEFGWGGSTMFFWRDPDVALAGLFVSHGEINDNHTTRYGAAGQLYLGQFDISAQAGYQEHNRGKDGAFGKIELGWYPVDDVRVYLGGDFNRIANMGLAGIEFRPGFEALPGMTLFLDGQIGENDHEGLLAGVRFYFGESTTLIDRHRRDDWFALIPWLQVDDGKKYFDRGKEPEIDQ
jgi:hypothetical protein